MNIFDSHVTEANKRDAFDEAFIWNLCESAVNNVHHGLAPGEWLPKVKAILESHKQDETNAALANLWGDAISYVNTFIEETN